MTKLDRFTGPRVSRRTVLKAATAFGSLQVATWLAACGGASTGGAPAAATTGASSATTAPTATLPPTAASTTAPAATSAPTPTTAAASASTPAPATKSAGKKLTITALVFTWNTGIPADGKGLQLINERFNVDYRPQFVPPAEFIAKLTTTVAGGEIPDVIVMEWPDSNFYKWAQQGAFLPLNDYRDRYPTLKIVPQPVWDAFTVNGKIYAVPKYFPAKYLPTPVVRKDWLDHLGLKVPTSYDELKQVALAFTKNDPTGTGRKDTYGMVMAREIVPDYTLGAYWDGSAWYHQNSQGQFLPGNIADGRKALIGWLADLYKEGAITRDFATITPANAMKEFWGGKAGIYRTQAVDGPESRYADLLKIDPKAVVVPIPPFKAPDGSTGFTLGAGHYNMTMLSAKLKNDPDKVQRILEMLDFGRQFYPPDQQTPANKDFDWLLGHEGQGYTMANGVAKPAKPSQGLSPALYLMDPVGWPPSDEANQYSKGYSLPQMRDLAAALEQMHADTKHYINPANRVYSETAFAKGTDLDRDLTTSQTKMIVGQEPVTNWDGMVQAYLSKGGTQIVNEINQALKAKGLTQRQWV